MKNFLKNTSTVIISIIIFAALISCNKDEMRKNVRGCICMYTDNEGRLLYYCGAGNGDLLWESNAILYPNPASSSIIVMFKTEGIHTVIIKKKIGKLMFQQSTSDPYMHVNISDFPDGNYVLIVVDEKSTNVYCLFKER